MINSPFPHGIFIACLQGGDLYFHLKRWRRFPEPLVRIWVAELTLALEYMHQLLIVYRDLKPENILLDGRGHVRYVTSDNETKL